MGSPGGLSTAGPSGNCIRGNGNAVRGSEPCRKRGKSKAGIPAFWTWMVEEIRCWAASAPGWKACLRPWRAAGRGKGSTRRRRRGQRGARHPLCLPCRRAPSETASGRQPATIRLLAAHWRRLAASAGGGGARPGAIPPRAEGGFDCRGARNPSPPPNKARQVQCTPDLVSFAGSQT